MDHLSVALLIPVAAIVMTGLVQIAHEFTRSRRHPNVSSLDTQVDVLEQELRSVRRELSEAQERLDFAERLLTQSQERQRLSDDAHLG